MVVSPVPFGLVKLYPAVPTAVNDVVLTPDWNGTTPAVPPAMFAVVVAAGADAQANAEPVQLRTVPVTVGATTKDVAPAPD